MCQGQDRPPETRDLLQVPRVFFVGPATPKTIQEVVAFPAFSKSSCLRGVSGSRGVIRGVGTGAGAGMGGSSGTGGTGDLSAF